MIVKDKQDGLCELTSSSRQGFLLIIESQLYLARALHTQLARSQLARSAARGLFHFSLKREEEERREKKKKKKRGEGETSLRHHADLYRSLAPLIGSSAATHTCAGNSTFSKHDVF